MEGKLTAFLKGEYRPTDNAERLGLAGFCLAMKRNHAGARLYGDVFAADPKSAEDLKAGHRYNAARCAVLAAAGLAKDASTLDDAEKARLREQALAWLRADLTLWIKRSEGGQPGDRDGLVRTMQHWQSDDDLAGVRDHATLAKLPEAERVGWETLWQDVETLQKRAQGKTP